MLMKVSLLNQNAEMSAGNHEAVRSCGIPVFGKSNLDDADCFLLQLLCLVMGDQGID